MVVLSPLLALDPVRLMMALANLTLVAIIGIVIECFMAYGWPERFQTRYADALWDRLYALAATTFLLTYFGTLWLLYAPRYQDHTLWYMVGTVEILFAGWALWRMTHLLRLLQQEFVLPPWRRSGDSDE